MRAPTTLAVLALALLLVWLPWPAVSSSPPTDEKPEAEESEKPLPDTVVPADIPESARRRNNPVPPARDSIVRGEWLFTSHCAMCHGARGDGTGELVGHLGLDMPDFTDPERQAARTDGELFYILSTGHGRMPPHADDFPEEYRWDLVNYLRTLDDEK